MYEIRCKKSRKKGSIFGIDRDLWNKYFAGKTFSARDTLHIDVDVDGITYSLPSPVWFRSYEETAMECWIVYLHYKRRV